MGGKPSQFGFDEEQLPEIVDRVRGASLNLHGLHMFAGTQLLDADVLLRNGHTRSRSRDVSRAYRRATEIHRPRWRSWHSVFLGRDGIWIWRQCVQAPPHCSASLADDPLFSGTRFIVEPGRFLAGPAGVYVARVVSVKHSRGTRFIVLDGGMNHHLAASGNLGQVIKKDYPIVNVSRPDDARASPP